ncbi:MAG TPA: Ig-like domain-containing protein, partial [Opitutus sp.]|nr:Ig-like domain-containing protein [Opitutus sp.]
GSVQSIDEFAGILYAGLANGVATATTPYTYLSKKSPLHGVAAFAKDTAIAVHFPQLAPPTAMLDSHFELAVNDIAGAGFSPILADHRLTIAPAVPLAVGDSVRLDFTSVNGPLIGDELRTTQVLAATVAPAVASEITVAAVAPHRLPLGPTPVPITISGTALNTVTAVRVGGITVAIDQQHAETLTFSVTPSNLAAFANVELVSSVSGAEVVTAAGFIAVVPPLAVTHVTPAVTGYLAGVTATIEGSGFARDVRLYVNDVLTPIENVSGDSQLTFVIPAGNQPLTLRLERSGAEPLVLANAIARTDNVPPRPMSIAPAAPAKDLPIEQTFRVTFSESIDVAQFALAAPLYLTDAQDQPVPATYHWTQLNTVVDVVPTSFLGLGRRYTLRFQGAIDTTGNASLPSENFAVNYLTVDQSPPTVAMSSPAAGATLLANSVVTLQAAVADNLQGVAIFKDAQNNPLEEGVTAARVVFYYNGEVIGPATAIVGGVASRSFTIPEVGSIISRNFHATAVDRSGNSATSAPVTVSVRPTIRPIIAFEEPTPADGSALAELSTFTIAANATVDLPFARTELKINDALVRTSTSANATFAAIPVPAASVGTSFTVSVTAFDVQGVASLPTVRSYTIAAESTPPAITLISPPANARIAAGQSLRIAASATDNKGIASVSFYLNGQASPAAVLTHAPYAFTLDSTAIPTGSAIAVRAVATDVTGLTAEDSRTITVVADDTKPVVAIVSPAAGEIFGEGHQVRIVVQATDDQRVARVELSV